MAPNAAIIGGNVSEGNCERRVGQRAWCKDVNKVPIPEQSNAVLIGSPVSMGDEHCGAEHSENVLEAEDEPFARGRLLSNVNQEFFLFH